MKPNGLLMQKCDLNTLFAGKWKSIQNTAEVIHVCEMR